MVEQQSSRDVVLLASFCTVLSGTCLPELLGWIEPSSSAKVIASPIEASSRNSDSGSRVRKRRVPEAKSPSVTSAGLRFFARPLCTDALAASEPRPLLAAGWR